MAATKRMNKELVTKYSDLQLKSSDLIEILRAQCLSRGAAGIKGLAKVFQIMDDNGNKRLDFNEFKKGLHDYGVDIANADCSKLFEMFDKDRNGSIDFEEFLQLLRPPMSMSRRKTVMEAFRKLDKNGKGFVIVEDLKNLYSVKKHPKFISGEWNEERCLKEFLESFELNGHDEKVTEEEFISYYSGVSASIDNDAYFDLMMRKAWKL
ncbi:hypothetical protein HELRODRAFT_83340 [Helobdella robusta]|uniref:EF-hand domain-containing protein n=1 Tax=Helobdella robusta TaxID=6412 RepID=T1G545_HELRO|nr:hypothetical protein HELRODRAFT_83340 [Helobdella robusta]ESO00246.1 hypothetical protein HELRODRAFT_83340 [Helobdella robusta]